MLRPPGRALDRVPDGIADKMVPYVGSCPGRAQLSLSHSPRVGRSLSRPRCHRCKSGRPGISGGELCGGGSWWLEGGGRD